MDMKRRCVLVWYFGNRLLVVFYFSAWSRAPFCSNCIQQLGVLTHSADPACLYSETSSHFKDPSGISANSFTSPLNTAPFLGQSGGPEDDAFPLVGSDRQYMPVQCPGCFITNEPADEDIFFIEVVGMDLLANVSPSIEMIMAMICIETSSIRSGRRDSIQFLVPCSVFTSRCSSSSCCARTYVLIWNSSHWIFKYWSRELRPQYCTKTVPIRCQQIKSWRTTNRRSTGYCWIGNFADAGG